MDLLTFKKSTTLYRHATKDIHQSILACGMIKKGPESDEYNICFTYYGALQIIEGSCHYQDAHNKEQILEKGDFLQRLPGHKHACFSHSKDYKEYFFCLGKNLYLGLCELGIIDNKHPVLKAGIHQSLLENWRMLYQYLEENNSTRFLNTSIDLLSNIKNYHNYENLHKLDEAKSYIENFPHRCWDIRKLSYMFSFSYEKFRKQFKERFNQSPYDYVIDSRIRLAQLCISSNQFDTFSELALYLGYPDIYSFSRQFKKITTLTPSQYKDFLYK